MNLKAQLEVSVYIKENESFETANERLLQKLIDVVDDWINNDGITPCIKVVYKVDQETVNETKMLN
tara:strand:+ start:3669 stop:3866 length:198 start_codon:yes stop_codon:yes gene_type:complete